MWAATWSLSGSSDEGERALAGRRPDLIIGFAQTDRLQSQALFSDLQRAHPSALVVGCSTGTTVSADVLDDDAVPVMGMGFDATPLRLGLVRIGDHPGSREVGEALGRQLDAPDLAGVFVLADGLATNGSALVEGLADVLGSGVAISGGLAGDGGRFGTTLLVAGGEVVANSVAAIGFYGKSIRIGVGSGGGWEGFGPQRTVSRSEGNVLLRLDDEPALDLYERYLGEDAADLPGSALLFPLMVWNPEKPDDVVVRTVLSIDRDARSMTFAGDIPEGWKARLMRGAFDHLTAGAVTGAENARAALGRLGFAPQACLVVSCVGRRLLMKQRTEDEIDGVRSAIGDGVPMTGFYSYGELAPHSVSGACAMQNQTVAVTVLAEAVP